MHRTVNSETAGKDALTKLTIFAQQYAKLNEDTGIDVMKVIFYPENQWFSKERQMQMFVRNFIQEGQCNGEIRRDYSVDDLTNSIFDSLRGICYNWCVCNGSFDLSQRMDTQIHLLCEAIKVQ